ncbi:MAG TPA: DNA mismatch repair protein MutS, partial [Candidatus Hodarchaeales archaeon]|nr:DNA mismatch repair protein MutS [Candidatus Hodarchaeales archaeon]
LLVAKANNYLASVHYDTLWGVALADVSTGEFSLAEFDTKEMLLGHLFRCAPSEILLSDEARGVFDDISKLLPGICVSKTEPYDFAFPDAYKCLTELFQTHSLDGFGLKGYSAGISAAGSIVGVLSRRRISFLHKELHVDNAREFLVIDIIARKNLELEVNLRDGSTEGTLLWVLDQTQTPMGARLLKQWLRKPLQRIEAINARLEAITRLHEDLLAREELFGLLQGLPDFERLAARVLSGQMSPREAARLGDGLRNLPAINTALEKLTSTHPVELLSGVLRPLPPLLALIDSALVENPPSYSNEGGVIRPGFDPELDRLRDLSSSGSQLLSDFEQKQQERLNQLAKTNGKKESKLKVAYNKGHGYYIEIRAGVPVPDDYVISRGLKDRVRYSTPELVTLASQVLEAEEQIVELEDKIFGERVLGVIRGHIDEILANGNDVARIDVLGSLARIANKYGYSRPELTDSLDHSIENGRHPVIERILPFGTFVANTTRLDNENRTHIITGANMGGKSTYLRQIALISIMAHMGSFVPATKTKIGIIDRIFTRVGVVDDIWHGQSHFMVEMNETANVLNNATEKSLILLDEIGRGTSTNTGLAIASSVIQYIHQRIKAKTLLATHFHQLNTLEKQLPGIRNYHVAIHYENNSLTFLYKLEKGGTDESFGLEVAKLAGFPQEVIENARSLRNIREDSSIDTNRKHPKTHQEAKSEHSLPLTHRKRSLSEFIEPAAHAELLAELETIDLTKITPIEALNRIVSWQERLASHEKGEKRRSMS